MKYNLKKEFPLLVIVAIPFIYLAYLWNELPAKVPMHWNLKGEVNRWGEKEELLLIPIILPLFVYVIFILAPLIDPKKQLKKIGAKYHSLKFLSTLFMSVLALFIIHTAKEASSSNPNYIFIVIGVLYIVFGNYFKTIKPNYFIGIRTPWTLENATVWKQTHQLGGKIWFVGGVFVIISAFVLPKDVSYVFFIISTLLLAFIPIIYSYILFKKIGATIE